MTYLISISIMGGIAAILGIILVLLDRYLADYGECRIRINDDTDFTVAGGESLISYLAERKIFIPSACGGKATCGFCKVTVRTGGGPVLPTEAPFLTKDDLVNNVRLACQVKVKSDIQVIIPEKYLSIEEFRAAVTEVRSLTYDTKEITLKLEEPQTISFRPGQYIQIRVPGTREYRAYSIASTPDLNDSIKLVVRLVPGGLCSSYIHKSVHAGDEITFTGPFGEFFLREDSEKDIICVAGGCGMAPFMSMIQNLFRSGTNRNVKYFFGAQTKEDLYYIEEFRKLAEEHENFKFIAALSASRIGDGWTGERGFIHKVLDKNLGDGKDMEAYICGPQAMIEAVIGVLMLKGFMEEDIFFDKF